MSPNASAPNTSLQETQFAPSRLVRDVISDGVSYEQTESESSSQIVESGHEIRLGGNDGSTLAPKTPAQPSSTVSARALAPDLLRGTIMLLQAIDHAAVTSTAYSHGQAIKGEEASTRLSRWNEPVGYIARLFTHLCAPGFMFLLGMGVAYFGRSRLRLGWTSPQLIRHFFIRAIVLVAINELLGLIVIRKLWPMFNIILLALAFNYFLTGIVWLIMTWTEPQLASTVKRMLPERSDNPETNPLLPSDTSERTRKPVAKDTAATISFYFHNTLLLVASFITIWWNIWLDPSQGVCSVSMPERPERNVWFEFFFHMLTNQYIFSGFPPLAWLAPALFGLLYGRLALARPWRSATINLANLAVGLTLTLLFVLTRLLHFGNLEEDCLGMPEHLANPHKNQYLASARSFFYITKYPPSPAYMFFALGCNFLLLALYGIVPAKMTKLFPFSVLLVFGTSALFFYALHLPLYSLLGAMAKEFFGHQMDFDDLMHPGRKAWGIGSGIVFWIDYFLGLLILYPLCKWYGRFKTTKGPDSVWRFL